ncbi:hypothetical protein GPECTOR_216g444 [Gonium pectorale]|uniref:COR domain-containing protein n=1 Tax=Gonium pectorale TaxID=33097 RepID=A0A150FYE2_GONPE|nr:hypothetical protein GPECTOR_216g444 [Gonium pectorale]|eukprot:KXZ42050.1 hypothetical protein GPECTOR_216g444 [Gonium pectorale]
MSNGFTPLHSACKGGHRDVVVELLRAGADHTLVSWDGKTPLDVAGSRGLEGLAELLRQHAADRSSAVQVAARSSLVLVGPGGAGKTTLAVRLVTGGFVEPAATHGLLVHEWLVPEQLPVQLPLLFSIWDLGGQEVYWSTHAFFMVREALYVTVYNSRDTQKDSVGEYLDRIKLLVPGKAPLLVATHAWEGGYAAQEPSAPVLQAHGIDSNAIIRLSSKTGQGVEELKQAIISAAANTSGPSADWLPQANLNVREEVRRMRYALVSTGKPPLIPLGELEEVAKRFSFAAPQDLRRCMDRLTDMGELRHFSDVPGLEDVVVIDPRWLADLMAKIVTTNKDRMQELSMKQGRTTMEALQKRKGVLVCGQCDAELPLAPFVRALRLDEQAAPWSPGQQQGDSDGGRRLRHLQAGTELLADWLAAAAGGQGQQRRGGPPDDAGGGGPPPLPELGEPELRDARRDLVRRVVAVHRHVTTPERRGHLPLLVALLPPPPPICGDDGPGGAGSSGAPPLLRLHPVCEHPEGPHPVEGHPGYDIPPLYDDPPGASWLRTHARGLRPLMCAMELMWRHGPREARGQVGGSGEAGEAVVWRGSRCLPHPPRYPSPEEAAILQAIIKRLEQEESEAHLSSCQPGSSPLPEGGGDKPGELDLYVSCQEARGSIEKLLEEGVRKADGGRSQGPLRRVVSRSGAVMWLCPRHAEEHVW